MIRDVKAFMQAADCTTDRHNPKQAALYIGLACEELAEALAAVGTPVSARMVNALADAFKENNGSALGKMTRGQRIELLDAAIDLAWVSIGLAYSIGGDAECAAIEVAASNMSKCVNGKMVRDANGKVKKPGSYRAPDLSPFIK